MPEIVPTLYSYIPRMAVALGCVVRIPGENRVYLTFDDGPDPESTPQILDILRENQAMASFFLIGEKAEKHPELVKDILAQGHTIGQHGYKHLNAWRHTSPTILQDLDAANRTIQDITGALPTMFRPPFGRIRPSMLRWARERNQKIILWDVMPAEYRRNTTSEAVSASVLRLTRSGSIIALHEGAHLCDTVLHALCVVLPALASRGFSFDAL